ncbi:MAG: LamG-like jellyroll fold domain-containing protein [Bacteroidota bacterium]
MKAAITPLKRVLLIILILWAFAINALAQLNRANHKKSVSYRGSHQRIASGQTSNSGFEIRNGTLWAWGLNSEGQLGDGTTTDRYSQVQIGSDNKWALIAGGSSSTLAIKSDGTLWGWGNNDFGQLGDGTNTMKLSPVQIGTDNKWVSLAAGWGFYLGIKSNGTLWAWGKNTNGQLGIGTTDHANSPVQVGLDNKWASIACGNDHSIGVKSDGTLWTWGLNTYGQLGDGGYTQRNNPVKIGTDTKWVSVSAGYLYTAGLKSDGTIWVWGSNRYGQYGNNSDYATSPIQSNNDNKWVSIACGQYNMLAIKSDGTLWKWGQDPGIDAVNVLPMQVGTETKWVSVVCGEEHVICSKSDGTVSTWGKDYYGQLGDGGGSNNKIDPGSITYAPYNEWININAGVNHTMAIRANGTLFAWGLNGDGQLGDGTIINKNNPVQIGTDTKWISLAGGAGHSIGLKSDGTLWAWGKNTNGQLGDNTTVNKNSPVQTGTDTKWVSIACGNDHSMGLKSDGTLWAWGLNTAGQLGDGTTTQRNSPVQIGSDIKWVSISAGGTHSIGLKSDGTIWTWGANTAGQLGDGTVNQKISPLQIGTDNKWVSAAGGSEHTIALKSDGSTWSFGKNNYGQLGDGSTTQRNSPVQIGTDWISIAAGDYHNLGLKQDGRLWAWGKNDQGQLGDATTTQRNSPVQNAVQNNIVAISCGGNQSGIIKTTRIYVCLTGDNQYGQLGNGTNTDATAFGCSEAACLSTLIKPAEQIINTIADACTAIYTIINPLKGNCSGASWGYSTTGATTLSSGGNTIANGSNANPVSLNCGTTTITLTANNGSYPITTISYYVVVRENQRPTLAAHTGVNLNVLANSCAANYTIASPVTDNCAGASWGYSLTGATTGEADGTAAGTNSGPVSFTKGITTITLSGLDASNNQAYTVVFTVTVTDNQAPVISCPGPVAINTTSGLCTGATTLALPTVTDNCGTSLSNALHFNNSNVLVGNSGLSLANTSFTIEFWADYSSFATGCIFSQGPDANPNNALRVGFVRDVANNSIVFNFSYPQGDSLNTDADEYLFGWHHYACTYDISNNVQTIYIDGAYRASKVTSAPYAGSGNTDLFFGRLPYNGTSSTGTLDEMRIWKTSRTATEIQQNMNKELSGAQPGLAAYYKFNEGVANQNNPGITTAIATVGTNGSLSGFTLSGDRSNWVTGNITTYTPPILTNNAPTVFPKGNTTVTWTATDASGNASTCTQVVTVNDGQAPTLASPGNQTFNAAANGCTASYTIADPITDNCSVSNWGYSSTGATILTSSGNTKANGVNSAVLLFNKGVTTVTLTGTDGTNAATSLVFTVTVNDTQVPTLLSPGNQTLNATANCAASYAIADPITDNCTTAFWGYSTTGATILSSSGNTKPNGTGSGVLSFNKGITTVTLTGTDGTNAAIATMFTSTIKDTTGPDAGAALTAICPGTSTPPLGGSITGTATTAIWSDSGAGGTFTNNSGTTPATTIYTAAANASGTITLKLTTTTGSCPGTDTKTVFINTVATWLGLTNDWASPGNWNSGHQPGSCTQVVINAGAGIIMPRVTGLLSTCKKLTVNTGASVTVVTGAKLMITGLR